MRPDRSVHPRQLDALREVVSIGAGRAATNLSSLTGFRVMISIPRMQWVEPSEQADLGFPPGDRLVMVTVRVLARHANPKERASLILARETAARMVGLLLRRAPRADSEDFDHMEKSTLKELGNIVCASYVGVLGTFLGHSVMIDTPELEDGPRQEIARRTRSGLLIETDFHFSEASFEGVFVLSHAEISFQALLDALGLADLS